MAGVSVAADEVVDAALPCLVADPVEDDPGDGEWDGRAGLFVRYEWTGGEISLAGGWSGTLQLR